MKGDVMGLVDEIDRRAGLSAKAFEREYLEPLRPVILTDAISHWPALGRWSPQFFKQHYGHLEVTVDGETLSLGDLVDQVEASSAAKPAPYLRNQPLANWPPELLADVLPMPECTRPNWFESRLFPARTKMTSIEAYIGGEGAQFPVLHWDGLHTHAYLMQLYGDKEYIVFGPDQTEFMYPRDGGNLSEIDDVLEPDLEKFPLYDRAEGVRFQLHPGETLFVPSGWWHTARILNPSVTVSINGLNRPNGTAFRHDYCELISRRSTAAAHAVNAAILVGGTTRLFELI
jgi:histone arginine demethylase JMJD6